MQPQTLRLPHSGLTVAQLGRVLGPGDRLGNGTVQPGHGGIAFADGSTLIGDRRTLAALGHALVMHFDPPGFDDVEAAGLSGDGTAGTGPHNWQDVARAALNRIPTIHIAEISTPHFHWLGTGTTDDQARDSLLSAWRSHAAHTGANPGLLRRYDLTVHHGVIGTAWRDRHAFAPPPGP